MDPSEILTTRLINQRIAATTFTQPGEIVHWMAAMQAQEYAMSKWAIGLRLSRADDAMVEEAFNRGEILRTHVLRPTWHFVSPSDIRWMLQLTAPHVHAGNAYMYRKMELDAALFRRSNDTLIKVLEGGKYLTRAALQTALQRKKIYADGTRLACLMMSAELDGLICSGPRIGSQFTYALLDERVPAAKSVHSQEALAKLTFRYFSSRGPATTRDFSYWSGLTLKKAQAGIEAVKERFEQTIIDGQPHFFIPVEGHHLSALQPAFLMPDYDEYSVSYKNRNMINGTSVPTVYNRMILLNGRIVGSWKRTLKKDGMNIDLRPTAPLSRSSYKAISSAVKAYGEFMSRKITYLP